MDRGIAAATGAIAVDADLVERARAGEAKAFEEIVGLHFHRVFRVALAILGEDADARDAVQEVFLRAWRELPGLREPGRFPGWLNRITVNICRTMLQRRRTRVLEITIEPLGEPLQIADPSAGHAERTADLDVLERAFERLGAEQRALLVLHHGEHVPLDQIAAALRIDPRTVKSRLFSARRALERALEVELR